MKTSFLSFLALSLLSCEPYNLDRIDFSNCVKPSATVGATITRLQVNFFVDRPNSEVSTVNWTFGDGRGLPQSGRQVSYTYDRPGNYTVTMSLINRCNQSSTISRVITIAN